MAKNKNLTLQNHLGSIFFENFSLIGKMREVPWIVVSPVKNLGIPFGFRENCSCDLLKLQPVIEKVKTPKLSCWFSLANILMNYMWKFFRILGGGFLGIQYMVKFFQKNEKNPKFFLIQKSKNSKKKLTFQKYGRWTINVQEMRSITLFFVFLG